MNLKENLTAKQLDKLEDLDIIIGNEDYTEEQVLELEKDLLEYIEENCLAEGESKDNINAKLTEEGYEIREIVSTLSDILYAEGDQDLVDDILEENEVKVKLKDGRIGILIDVTNSVATIEIDEKFRTGNLDEDIVIIEYDEIEILDNNMIEVDMEAEEEEF